MGKSLDELRSSLRKIREDISQLPATPRKIEPLPEPALGRPEPLPSVSERREQADVDEELLEKPEPPMREVRGRQAPAAAKSASVLTQRTIMEAVFLAVASAGAFAGNRVALGAGLFGLLVTLLVGSRKPIDDSSTHGDELARRLDDLERRISDRAFSSESGGGVSPELEEQIREMRRILMSLMTALEEQSSPAARRTEGDQ